MNWLKVVPYFALGQFSTKGLGTSLALLPLAIAANLLGFWLVRVTPQDAVLQDHAVIMFADLDRADARGRDWRSGTADKRAAALANLCAKRGNDQWRNATHALRYRSRPQPGQFPAADAARLSRARGRRVPATTPPSSTGRCGAPTPSSTRARGGSPRRWPSAASSAATPCRCCSPIRRRCWNATTACR